MDNEYLPDAVDRWSTTGGTWRVAQVGADSASIELLRCDGGEIVEMLTLDAEVDLAWARLHDGEEAGS